MEEPSYCFEIKKVARLVKVIGARRVLVQLPEGMKRYAPFLHSELKSLVPEATILFLGDPTYGPCDIALKQAEALGVDIIIHYGHPPAKIPQLKIPTLFLPAYSKIRPQKALKELVKTLKELEASRVGLSAVIQHQSLLSELSAYLRREGFEVMIGSSTTLPPGVILGCDYQACLRIDDMVDAHIIIAGGLFHALGLRCLTHKPVFALDPYRDQVVDVEKEYRRLYAVRLSRLIQLEKAKTFGVLMCTKSGQLNLNLAMKIRRLIEEHGREAIIIAVDNVNPEWLASFENIDAFVNTCCPRLSLDDGTIYGKPIIAPYELMLVFSKDLLSYRPRVSL